ncbi:MAG TPA: OmpA family protein [Burkholderiales bacterium]|nr:OmpA family protein [Burkholderiales bacterium]
MRRALAVVMLAVALVACATQRGATGRGAQRATHDEPEALRPDSSGFREVTLIILPKPDGGAGSVVVRRGKQETVVDKPYAAATVRADGTLQPAAVDVAQVQAEFGDTLNALPPRPQVLILHFVEGKDEFTPESLSRLDAVLAEIQRRPAPEITVTGHTDTAGSRRFNDKLSLARAKRVRDELVRRGIPTGHIVSVAGRGEREPVVPTAEGVTEPLNRRVEIGVR